MRLVHNFYRNVCNTCVSSALPVLNQALFTLSVLLISGLLLSQCSNKSDKYVTIVKDRTLKGPANHGLNKLKEALIAQGYHITDATSLNGSNNQLVIILGERNNESLAATEVSKMEGALNEGPESLIVST